VLAGQCGFEVQETDAVQPLLEGWEFAQMLKSIFGSIRRVFLAALSYVVGASVQFAQASNDPKGKTVEIYLVAGLAVVALMAWEEFFSNIRPARRLEEITPLALDGFAKPLLELLDENRVRARLNFLVPVRMARFLLLRRHFKIRWGNRMEDQPDVNIHFPIASGITGECYRTGQPIHAGPDELKDRRFALPGRAGRRATGLEVVFSYPIYEPPRKGGLQSGRLLGVLNLDSRTPHAYGVFMSERVFEVLDDRLRDIATLVGRFYR